MGTLSKTAVTSSSFDDPQEPDDEFSSSLGHRHNHPLATLLSLHTKRRNKTPRQTAIELVVHTCQCHEDGEFLEEMAQETLRILGCIMHQARTMELPYSISNKNNERGSAEDDEELFETWESLFCRSDPKATRNHVSPQAKSYFPDNPDHADRLLWARQALQHYPDMEEQWGSDMTYLHKDSTEQRKQFADDPFFVYDDWGFQQRDIVQWAKKWCLNFGVPPEQWILLIPARELAIERCIRQIRDSCWDWLVSTLQKALAAWGLKDVMTARLTHPVVQYSWKQPGGDILPAQCLVFVARVFCLSNILLQNPKTSSIQHLGPTLMAKVLRCIHMLQLPEHRRVEHVSIWELFDSNNKKEPSSPQRNQPTLSQGQHKEREMEGNLEGGALVQSVRDLPVPQRKEAVDSAPRDSHSVSESSAHTSTSLKRPWHGKKLDSDDPVAVKLLQEAGTIDKLLQTCPVEQLDMESGKVLQTFATGYQALESVSDTLVNMEFYKALIGRKRSATDASGHFYNGFFWRCKGSTASPRKKPSPGNKVSPWAGAAEPPHDPIPRKEPNGSHGDSDCVITMDRQTLDIVPGCETKKNFDPLAIDPFADKLLKEGRSRKQILVCHAVEQLNIKTGDLMATFSSAREALTHISGNVTADHFFSYSLFGQRRNPKSGELMGHVYKGYFWRLKGSKALPSSGEARKRTRVWKKVDLSAVVDPFVSSLIKNGKSRTQILKSFAVEQLDIQSGDVLATFPSALDALSHLSGNVNSRNYLYLSLLGLRKDQNTQKLWGNIYKGYFWRLKGSKALPSHASFDTSPGEEKKVDNEKTEAAENGKKRKHDYDSCPSDDQDEDDKSPMSRIEGDSRIGMGKFDETVNSTNMKNSMTTMKTFDPSVTDPFADKLLKEGLSRKQIMVCHAVEQLNIKTGDLMATFPSAREALTHISGSDTAQSSTKYFFLYSLLGQRRCPATKKLMGHVYKGYFWRLKGSKALPGGTGCDASTSKEKKKANSEQTQAKDIGQKRKREDDLCLSENDNDGEDELSMNTSGDNSTIGEGNADEIAKLNAAVAPSTAAPAQSAVEEEDVEEEETWFVDV